MKDFVSEAKRMNIHIYGCNSLIQSYSISRHTNHVKINYIGEPSEYKSLDEVNIEELDKKHEQDFEKMKKEIIPKTKKESTFYGIMAGLYIGLGIFLRFVMNNVSGFVWFSWSGMYFAKANRPWKLKKELELTGWIYDHRQQADQVIQSEVNEHAKPTDTKTETINARISENDYPYDSVPYTKAMYDEGINLNNINDINYRDMKKLKRKVLKLERRRNNEQLS